MQDIKSFHDIREARLIHHNFNNIFPVWQNLNEIRHLQGPTPIKIDSSTFDGLYNKVIFQKKSKSWAIQWNRMKDKILSKELWVYCDKGDNNKSDYVKK